MFRPSLRWPVPLTPKLEMTSPRTGQANLPLPEAMISASVGAALVSTSGRDDGGGVIGWAATGALGRGLVWAYGIGLDGVAADGVDVAAGGRVVVGAGAGVSTRA